MRKLKNLLLIIAISFSAISFANTNPIKEGKLVRELKSMMSTPNFEVEYKTFNVVFTVDENDIINILRIKDENRIIIENDYTKYIKDMLNGKTLFSPIKTNEVYILPITFKPEL